MYPILVFVWLRRWLAFCIEEGNSNSTVYRAAGAHEGRLVTTKPPPKNAGGSRTYSNHWGARDGSQWGHQKVQYICSLAAVPLAISQSCRMKRKTWNILIHRAALSQKQLDGM